MRRAAETRETVQKAGNQAGGESRQKRSGDQVNAKRSSIAGVRPNETAATETCSAGSPVAVV